MSYICYFLVLTCSAVHFLSRSALYRTTAVTLHRLFATRLSIHILIRPHLQKCYKLQEERLWNNKWQPPIFVFLFFFICLIHVQFWAVKQDFADCEITVFGMKLCKTDKQKSDSAPHRNTTVRKLARRKPQKHIFLTDAYFLGSGLFSLSRSMLYLSCIFSGHMLWVSGKMPPAAFHNFTSWMPSFHNVSNHLYIYCGAKFQFNFITIPSFSHRCLSQTRVPKQYMKIHQIPCQRLFYLPLSLLSISSFKIQESGDCHMK